MLWHSDPLQACGLSRRSLGLWRDQYGEAVIGRCFGNPSDLGHGNSLFGVSPVTCSKHHRIIALDVLYLDRVAPGWFSIVLHCEETLRLVSRCTVEAQTGLLGGAAEVQAVLPGKPTPTSHPNSRRHGERLRRSLFDAGLEPAALPLVAVVNVTTIARRAHRERGSIRRRFASQLRGRPTPARPAPRWARGD
jgi:hypothetical protein